jgi:hypothetical protein
MMEAVGVFEKSVIIYQTARARLQKTVIFVQLMF